MYLVQRRNPVQVAKRCAMDVADEDISRGIVAKLKNIGALVDTAAAAEDDVTLEVMITKVLEMDIVEAEEDHMGPEAIDSLIKVAGITVISSINKM